MNWENPALAQQKAAAESLAAVGGLSAAQNQARDRSQFEVSAERHAMALSRLSERIGILRDRLQPVLRPSNPSPAVAGEGRKPQESLAPIADALNQITGQIDGLTFQTEDLLNRLAF